MCTSKEKAMEAAEISRAVEDLLEKAAASAKPCPSNDWLSSEVSRQIGRDVRSRQIEYAVKCLRKIGKIETTNSRGGYRQVYVASIGKWTEVSKNERSYRPRRNAARTKNTKEMMEKRLCLTCGTMFNSLWSGNRRCDPCKNKASWRNGNACEDFASPYWMPCDVS